MAIRSVGTELVAIRQHRAAIVTNQERLGAASVRRLQRRIARIDHARGTHYLQKCVDKAADCIRNVAVFGIVAVAVLATLAAFTGNLKSSEELAAINATPTLDLPIDLTRTTLLTAGGVSMLVLLGSIGFHMAANELIGALHMHQLHKRAHLRAQLGCGEPGCERCRYLTA